MRRSRLGILLLLALAGIAPASAQAPAADRRTHGAANCRAESPVQWNTGHITWLGNCKNGYADGLGALRNVTGEIPDELFLGRLDRGSPSSGVLVTAQGYTAGSWRAGTLTTAGSDDQATRNALLAAFQVGAQAADSLSKAQAARSHRKTARFYTRLAQRLRSQMD